MAMGLALSYWQTCLWQYGLPLAPKTSRVGDSTRESRGIAEPLTSRCPESRWRSAHPVKSAIAARRAKSMKIGVLALQGDFDAHRRRLEELGADVVLVKKPEQLDEIDGLVIPGGESGTFLKLLGNAGFEKLKQFVRFKPTFGTCAGAILLANEVENPKQAGLGAIDMRIRRNAYGRQIDSSIRQGKLLRDLNDGGSRLEMVFIRAPKIERVGKGVEIIATEGSDPVAVRQGRAMAATFHPELSDDTRVHRIFLDLVRDGQTG
jgi:pyridoxal 5'-phosphate synthase pdxT subunit